MDNAKLEAISAFLVSFKLEEEKFIQTCEVSSSTMLSIACCGSFEPTLFPSQRADGGKVDHMADGGKVDL